jgi:dolichol kinase
MPSLLCYFLDYWLDHDQGGFDAAADMFCITLGAFACCVADALPFGNDNLLIPLITDAGVQTD